MPIKYSKAILCILLACVVIINACGNKDNADTKTDGEKKSGGTNSDLLIKDEKGTRVNLVLKPKKGEVFKYKMNAKTTSKEKSPLTEDKELTSVQDINYYYSEEVNDVASSGIITYRIKFDSITILSSVASADSSIKMTYNSNVKDSVYSKPDFIQYNSIMSEEFFARVSPQGEISEIYGLEKVYDNMYKALGGDTLSAEQKESLKQSFGNDAIKAVLQQQFQMFPQKEIYKDSTWTRSYETQILIFPVKNILNYKLNDIKTENDQVLLTIDADLAVDIMEKEVKEKQMSYRIEDSKTGGKGVIVYNLSRGCVSNKETSTNIEMDLKISAGGQSLKTMQKVATELKVSLIQ